MSHSLAQPHAAPSPPPLCSDAGKYSAEGGDCQPCPVGQYAPSPGLPDQTSITGIPCIKCAAGSMPRLDSGVFEENTASAIANPTEGSTFCDAW